MTIKLEVDFRSGEPIYLQIVNQIQQMIAEGELEEGDQLPTVRQLATDLRVNFNTVARAYRILDDAGLISTQQGRGTYVWEQPSEETIRKLRAKSLGELTRRYLDDVKRLGYHEEEVKAEIEKQVEDWHPD
jgi:GntR family transcriptional regulator